MIKVKRKKDGSVKTKIKGDAKDIAEQLLNATVSIIEALVSYNSLDEDKVEDFVSDFSKRVLEIIKEDKQDD